MAQYSRGGHTRQTGGHSKSQSYGSGTYVPGNYGNPYARTGRKPPHGHRGGKGGIVVALILVVALGGGIFWGARHILGGSDVELVADGVKVTFVVEEGQSATAVAAALQEQGFIRSSKSFLSEVESAGASGAIKPGSYSLVGGMTDAEIVDTLVAGPVFEGVTLTIPEGYTIEQIASRVEETCGISADEFTALAYNAAAYQGTYSFLEGVYNNSMEGYLFPKTYAVAADATADDIIRMLLDQFQTEFASVDLSYATSCNLTAFEVVTIASCIEKEAYFSEDRTKISSVIYNRLRAGMTLGLDVTTSYAVGKAGTGEELTAEDLDSDSPYNTRKNLGLPAGPICSPGLESLQAAAAPDDTPYLYFILTSEYSEFYETDEEFVEGKARWQAGE